MASQAKILAFDDARQRTRTSSRSNQGSGRSRSAARVNRSPQTSSRYSRSTGSVARPSWMDDDFAFSAEPTRGRRGASRGDAFADDSFDLGSSRRSSRAPRQAIFDESSLRDESTGSRSTRKPRTLSEKLEKKRHDAKKAKAEKKFNRQFSDDSAVLAREDSGSRAALYGMNMGSRHKRSVDQMANDSRRGSSTSRTNSRFNFGSFGSIADHPILLTVGMAMIVLVAACAFVYPTAQQYYHCIRQNDRLAAEYAALEDRNNAIQSSIDTLNTNEGVAAEVRANYGWVSADEQAVNVYGLENVTHDTDFRANIVAGSVPAPETWYSQLLDPIFGPE